MGVSDNFNGWANRKKSHDKIILAISIIAAVVVVAVVLFVMINKGHNNNYNNNILPVNHTVLAVNNTAPAVNNTAPAVNSQSFENISAFSEKTTNDLIGQKLYLQSNDSNDNLTFFWKSMRHLSDLTANYSFVACSDNANFTDIVPCNSGKYMIFHVNITPYTTYLANMNSSFTNYYFYSTFCMNSDCDYYISKTLNSYSEKNVIFEEMINSQDYNYNFSINIIPAELVGSYGNETFKTLTDLIANNRSVEIYFYSGDVQ